MHFVEARTLPKRSGVFVLCTATTLLLKVVLKRGLENLKTVSVAFALYDRLNLITTIRKSF